MNETMTNHVTRALATLGNHHQCEWRELARAAIAALREPTEAMVEAGLNHIDPCRASDLAQAWRAMIDAALEE